MLLEKLQLAYGGSPEISCPESTAGFPRKHSWNRIHQHFPARHLAKSFSTQCIWYALSVQSALTSSELLLPAQNVLIRLKFLLTSAELCVTWEQSVSCSHTLLHVPQRPLCPGRSISLGQLVATLCFLCSWTPLKEVVWNAVVNVKIGLN